MRPSQTLIAALAFALAAVLSYAGAVWSVKGVERRTRQIVSHELSLEGFDWARVETDGLQVRLTGTAPNEAARFRVLAVVDRSVDSARVHDLMQTEPAKEIAPPRFSVELLRNDEGISLIGLVPAATGRDAIAAKVAALHVPGQVSDLLETAEAPVPEGWDAALGFGLVALNELPRAKISIAAGEVHVTGISDSEGQQRRYETDLMRAAPAGLKVVMDISAPRPVITPFTLRFLIDDQGARFDACSADTDKARDLIEKAGVEAGVSGKISCTVGMGVPTPSWADAAVLGIQAVKELGRGAITFSDADVTLLAPAGVDQATFDRVVGDLGAKLPAVFSLNATLEKPAKVAKAEGPVEFTAALTSDGHVTLRGRLTDTRMHDAVDSYAKARFGAGNVFTATRVDEKLPDGWPVRVLAGLEALSVLHDGSLLVQPDLVSISGTSGAQDAKDQISRILSDKLGPGQAFQIKVVYDKRWDTKANEPTPKDCVAAVQKAMAAHKIAFEPGSDSFTPESAPTLDAIAAEVRKCPDAKLEIAGYTDSQGRTEMNLALSQSRAQAVLQALANRRVLIGNVIARGYGEAHPIADNSTDAGREANRRIEITLQADAPDAGQAQAPDAGGSGAAAAPDTATDPAPDTGSGDQATEPDGDGADMSGPSDSDTGSDTAADPAAGSGDAAPAPGSVQGLAPDVPVVPKPRPTKN